MSKELPEEMMNRLTHEDTGECIQNEDRSEKDVKKYLPSVLKLKLELVDFYGDDIEWTNDELAVLHKYAKMQNGFTREVLVPSSMSLNALNYMIQRLYGWHNCHMHGFSLTNDVFSAVTDDGNIEQWKKLCGVLFRYPEKGNGDRYCGDDYDGSVSFKTWLKNKYCGTEPTFCLSDTYIENQRMIAEDKVMWNKLKAQGVASLEEIGFGMDLDGPCDTLVERLTLGEILSTSARIPDMALWREETAVEIEAKQKLIEQYKDTQIGGLSSTKARGRSRGYRVPREKIMHSDISTSADRSPSESEPKIKPMTDTLLYSYDYGDDWCVRVSCTEEYYIDDSLDYTAEQGEVRDSTMPADDKEPAEDRAFFAYSTDAEITGDYAGLLRNTAYKKAPMCLSADGICLLDDVGGVHGFVDMLRTIHGKDPNEAEEMREWAREMGWTGRMSKPEKML